MAITKEHQPIWDFLWAIIPNAYGAAGLMGNLFAESSLNSLCVTGTSVKTKEQKDLYIQKLRNGQSSIEEFSKDGVAFGLAQWRYWSRKEALVLYARDHGTNVTDLMCQLNFLHQEIQTYKTVWQTLKSATSIKEASDIVMERYEKPGNVSDQAKAKRAAFGQECYDLFATKVEPDLAQDIYVVTTMDKVNLRTGNGKNYGTALQAKQAGEKYKWVATAMNGWYAVDVPQANGKSRVLWVSPEYSKKIT